LSDLNNIPEADEEEEVEKSVNDQEDNDVNDNES
jgi:hypothetical protein